MSESAVHSSARLTENIAALSLLQCLAYAVPLITIPHIVRALGPLHYGLVSFSQALVLFFGVATDYGFNLSATRKIATQRLQPDALARTFWSTIAAKMLLMLAGAAVLIMLVVAVPRLRQTPLMFAASFLNVIGTAIFPVWFFQGLERLRSVAIAQTVSRLLTVPALFLFVHGPGDDVTTAVIQSSTSIVSTLFLLPLALRCLGFRWHVPTLSDIRSELTLGRHLFMSNVTLMLSTSSTAVILGAVAGNEQVGYFSAADKVIRAASSMLNPVSQALYPHLAALNEESPARALQLVRKSFWLITSIAFAVSVGAFFFSGPVSRAVFGHQFRASVPVLHWLSFLPVLFALMSILGTQTMMVFHLDALLSRIVLQCSVAGLLLVAVLSWLFGAVGAAVGSVATIMAIVAYMASALRKRNLAVWRNGTR